VHSPEETVFMSDTQTAEIVAIRQHNSKASVVFKFLFWGHQLILGLPSAGFALDLLIEGKAQGIVSVIGIFLAWIGGTLVWGLAALIHDKQVYDLPSSFDTAQMAAMAARYGSALYGWAIKRGSVETNPFERLPIAPIVRRKRVLSDEEIRRIWTATAGPSPFNGIVRALLLTGARREEVAGMTWVEVASDLSAWSLSAARSKNGLPHLVPLSAPMQTLLRSQPRFEGIDLVFAGERGVFSGWSKSKRRLDEESQTGDWTLHDLRRTVATRLGDDLSIQPHVVEACLNHVSGHKAGVAGIYNRAAYANERRVALTAWGERVGTIVEGREAAGNVTPLRRGS
jgi:integrase